MGSRNTRYALQPDDDDYGTSKWCFACCCVYPCYPAIASATEPQAIRERKEFDEVVRHTAREINAFECMQLDRIKLGEPIALSQWENTCPACRPATWCCSGAWASVRR